MAVKTEITIAEMAKSFFKKTSLIQKLRHKFSTVIKSDTPGAIRRPNVFVSWASPIGLP